MTSAKLSNTKIDQLGDRLRQGNFANDDLRLLDVYRRSFGRTYETVVRTARQKLSLEPTGRPAKSTTAIIAKLRRESIRLSQVQDIAGCRLIVSGTAEQERVVESVKNVFADATVVDRRRAPTHGYRAVHVIVSIEGKLVEVQIRTALQHQWAEVSEKFSDLLDPSIKYGGGDQRVRSVLAETSGFVAEVENGQAELARLTNLVDSLASPPESLTIKLNEVLRRQGELQQRLSEVMARTLVSLEQAKRDA